MTDLDARRNQNDRDRRLGRSIVFVHQQDPQIPNGIVRAELEGLLLAGRSMDFAARIKEYGNDCPPTRASQFAKLAGIGRNELINTVLPALQKANIVSYAHDGAELTWIEEYVGVSAPMLNQAVRVFEALGATNNQLAVLHSVEVASWAPLSRSQHLDQLVSRGFTATEAEAGLQYALAIEANSKVASQALSEDVIFNHHVWGAQSESIASFLRSLPSVERDALLSVCADASDSPGLALASSYSRQDILRSARKVGLIETATVKSSGTSIQSQTYVFSPLMESRDDAVGTTEALHQRKLFVAHILFGHDKASSGGGRVRDPAVLVNALIKNGKVGPASNIATDYHLLEAQGIIEVEEIGNGRAFLKLVKEDIVKDGLGLLQRMSPAEATEGGEMSIQLSQSPADFISPERERGSFKVTNESDEIAKAAILKLREQTQRVASNDDF